MQYILNYLFSDVLWSVCPCFLSVEQMYCCRGDQVSSVIIILNIVQIIDYVSKVLIIRVYTMCLIKAGVYSGGGAKAAFSLLSCVY